MRASATLLLTALLTCFCAHGRAAELDDFGFGMTTEPTDPTLEALTKQADPKDLLLLRDSVLLERELAPKKWDTPGPEAKLLVPARGTYKIWLRHRLGFARQMTFDVHWANGGRTDKARLGKYRPDAAILGKTLEKKFPCHLDQPKDRIGPAPQGAAIWESFEAKLDDGPLTLSVAPLRQRMLKAPTSVDRVFLTRSKTYKPEDSHFRETYLRFRIVESVPENPAVTFGTNTTYHAPFRTRTNPGPIWYSSYGAFSREGKPVPPGQWTDWVELREHLLNGGGFMTCWFGTTPRLKSYRAEAQMAWRPLPGAVLKTVQTSDRALLVPVNRRPPGSHEEVPTGVRDPNWMARFETAEDVARRHEKWIEEAELPDLPTPKQVRVYTGCGVVSERDMLRRLGFNDFDSFTYCQDALFYAGSHCPNDPKIELGMDRIAERKPPYKREDRRRIWKLGDEIGTIVGGRHIAGCTDCLGRYHAFVREQGYDAADFGLDSLSELPYGELPGAQDGRPARLARMLSREFGFVNTVSFYKRFTEAIERHHPRDLTSVNYTPHSDLMFSAGMHRMPWFSLCRARATTAGWGEGWISGGSWGFGGVQTISYYAAIVEAEGRPHDMPWGFYAVMSMGQPDRKLLTLIGRGADVVNAYTFGPAYAGAEMSNFWSERRQVYQPIGMTLRIVGAADEVMAAGRPPKADVAVLYNLAHERFQVDGAVTFERRELYIGLLHSHIRADIVIDEDLNPETLRQYKVLYLTGECLSEKHMKAVKDWAKAGGTVIAHGGVGTRNEIDSLTHELDDLFGASQLFRRRIRASYQPRHIHGVPLIDTLKFDDNTFFTAREIPVLGYKVALRPTTGKVVGRFADGTPAAVVNSYGNGKAVLIGALPGLAYRRGTDPKRALTTYRALERDVLSQPAIRSGITRPVTCGEPLVEAHVLASEKGWAVTLINWKYADIPDLQVRIHTDQTFTSARSSLQGKLDLTQGEGTYTVTLPLGMGDAVVFEP